MTRPNQPAATDVLLTHFLHQARERNQGAGASPEPALLAQTPRSPRPTILQSAAQHLGDVPVLGDLIHFGLNIEDRAHYRDADPRLRRLLHLQ